MGHYNTTAKLLLQPSVVMEQSTGLRVIKCMAAKICYWQTYLTVNNFVHGSQCRGIVQFHNCKNNPSYRSRSLIWSKKGFPANQELNTSLYSQFTALAPAPFARSSCNFSVSKCDVSVNVYYIAISQLVWARTAQLILFESHNYTFFQNHIGLPDVRA